MRKEENGRGGREVECGWLNAALIIFSFKSFTLASCLFTLPLSLSLSLSTTTTLCLTCCYNHLVYYVLYITIMFITLLLD